MRRSWSWMSGATALAAAIGAFAPPAGAQYFGQNKVQYRKLEFQVIQTEHFEVYYYGEERAAALDAARMAERGYARLSRVLHHQFTQRKPIILYASHTDFEQTNAIEGELGEGTGGVTEFFKHRMVLPFTGSTPTSSTCCSTRWCTSSSTTSSPAATSAAACRRW